MYLRPTAALLTSCGALALAACGSSSSSSTPTTGAPPATSTPATTTTKTPAPSPAKTAAGASTLSLQADPSGALAFVQKSLTAKAGKVTIDFANQSPVPHDVVIEQAGNQVGGTAVFSGGSKSLTVTLAKGTYTFFCSVDSHRAAGMQGTLTVN